MPKIPFIDLANVNCWIVYMLPFDAPDKEQYELVLGFQKNCIKNNIFGMGWSLPSFELVYGTPMTEENAADYVEKYNNDEYNKANGYVVSKSCVDDYLKVKKNDYIIMRLKNSHYYVGRVVSDKAKYLYEAGDEIKSRLSWGAQVDKWVEYSNDGLIPSEIAGRFSQQMHKTIQRIDPYRQRMLVIAMYERFENNKKYNIPKLRIGISNFVRSLNYMELEDLVSLYISKRHEKDGYRLLPSSCKISQQNYEFRFVSVGKKPITCQVKNQEEICVDQYVNEESYEKIYIFSGKWGDNLVNEMNQLYSNGEDSANIHIISPKELFETLKDNNVFENDFYDFENEPITADSLPTEKLPIYKKRNYKNKDIETELHDFAYFIRSDGLFYSAEFGAVVLKYHIIDDHMQEKERINDIMNIINGE